MRPMRWILGVVLAMALTACGTNEPTAECESNQDCTGDPGAGCEWMCIDHDCEKVCPQQCQADADCEDLPWESQCTGHWECIDNECEPVCDPVACTEVADCLELTPPGDCEGHWECTREVCVWICDKYPCAAPEDCQEIPWPVRCPGHWECTDGYCDPVCGSTECQTPDDCENLTLPCDQGYWICENGQCLPVCKETCQSVADCLDLPWNLKCPGHWACEQGTCVEICDDVACGDKECDPAGGETPDSCSLDCSAACQAPVDCVDLVWDIRCVGHWDCENGQCLPVCDFVGCGDGQCDRNGGESPQSCPEDC